MPKRAESETVAFKWFTVGSQLMFNICCWKQSVSVFSSVLECFSYSSNVSSGTQRCLQSLSGLFFGSSFTLLGLDQ